jgi:hypothetical protein
MYAYIIDMFLISSVEWQAPSRARRLSDEIVELRDKVKNCGALEQWPRRRLSTRMRLALRGRL